MKVLNKIFVVCLVSLLFPFSGCAPHEDNDFIMWYEQPAREWMEALPMGNGRLGAMVYGGIENEKIALNEITMWSGQPDSTQDDLCGKENLKKMRELFFQGKIEEGNMMGSACLSGAGKSFGTHLPVGDLDMRFVYGEGEIKDYRRQLDLENSILSVSFEKGGVNYFREYFCSNPDDVMVMKYTADKSGKITTTLSLNMLRESKIRAGVDGLSISGKVSFPKLGPGGVSFLGMISVLPVGGNITFTDSTVTITDADELVVLTDIRTNYKSENYNSLCAENINLAKGKDYEILKSSHVKDYRSLYSRMSISLGDGNNALPTDVRREHIKAGKSDPAFDALFYQYGRYMLISSSRPGAPLPANLQGIWNDNLACNMPWTCDYHLDINIQQNYWSANVANLHECNEPLFDYIRQLSVAGHRTAGKVYGCDGWVAHTIANAWGYTAPAAVGWGMHPTAGAWIATHLWTHYLYTRDKEYLKVTGYPLLKETAKFFKDYMIEDPNSGYLVTGPSISPENAFRYNNGNWSLSMMPTVDRCIVYSIYTACIESCKILGVDEEFRETLENDLSKLPPLMIGKNGNIQEWLMDVERAEPNHRHSSHLLCLYPLGQISYTRTPELMAAARKSVESQLNAPGWEDTEWSRANMINFYARLKDASAAYNSLQGLYREFSRENLMTVSPAGIAGAENDIFSFDANEAGVSGISEMLLQSYDGFLEFLPALPAQWARGQVSGICAQGGLEINMSWREGRLKNASVKATKAHHFRLKLSQSWGKPLFRIDGKELSLDEGDGYYTVNLNPGSVLSVRY